MNILIRSNQMNGIAVNKNNTDLAGKINDGLKKLREKGVYDELYRKWFNQ
ncbi:transporter substrate-binding domain-containing protein [Succinivibrio dextrinosolvens]|nr:transporter substrate-binding domain-containing protein [Succinivibrio dextrinosolvens]